MVKASETDRGYFSFVDIAALAHIKARGLSEAAVDVGRALQAIQHVRLAAALDLVPVGGHLRETEILHDTGNR